MGGFGCADAASLAVHGWCHRNDVDATAKITWLRQRGWLFDSQLRHEVFTLISRALPTAASDIADGLVADANAGPAEVTDEQTRERLRFGAVQQIARTMPTLNSAQDALAQLQAAHPEFDAQAHADPTPRNDVGVVPPRPPMTTDELHDRISTDPTAAIRNLRIHEHGAWWRDEPTWQDAMATLAATISAHPADGFKILDADGGDERDIVAAVIDGWASAAIEDANAEPLLDRLLRIDLVAVADPVSRLLAGDAPGNATSTDWHRFPVARQLAADLWTALPRQPPDKDVTDWLSRAINRPAGRVAQFWARAVAYDWRAAADTWSGLTPALRTQLERLLDGDDDVTAMAQTIIASQLGFFFGADRDWCETHVLPLLDWEAPHRARRAWDGFLYWGRENDQLLNAGLLDQYLQAARHHSEFRDDLCELLYERLARIAVASDVDTSWINAFTADADPDARVEWMRQVAWTLGKVPAPLVEHQWQRWMRKYWDDRLGGSPRQLTDGEASAMAGWTVYLTDSFEEAVDRATSHPAGLEEHGGVLRDLARQALDRAPAACARLIAHLLRHTQMEPYYDCDSLADIVRRIEARPEPVDVSDIREGALRLGCLDASGW